VTWPIATPTVSNFEATWSGPGATWASEDYQRKLETPSRLHTHPGWSLTSGV
jgi:hypothetical protein